MIVVCVMEITSCDSAISVMLRDKVLDVSKNRAHGSDFFRLLQRKFEMYLLNWSLMISYIANFSMMVTLNCFPSVVRFTKGELDHRFFLLQV